MWVLLNEVSNISINWFWNPYPLSSWYWVQFLKLTHTFSVINQLWDIIWCCVPFCNILSHLIHSQNTFFLSLCNQNKLPLFKRNITFLTEVWSSSLIKEIIVWISSLISWLTLKYSLKTFKISIACFIWWILYTIDNSWKKQIWMLSGGFFWYKPRNIFCQNMKILFLWLFLV